MNLFIGTTAMSLNIAQAKKLKEDLKKLERKNMEAVARFRQLESEKVQLAAYAEPPQTNRIVIHSFSVLSMFLFLMSSCDVILYTNCLALDSLLVLLTTNIDES
ncbi:hypothetical protein BC833DRAFT_621326 [Globomyces pollinis-pini]|nr:hypothetical protein BC833DRAFT_621326 [Globomyces pollinis-pini]